MGDQLHVPAALTPATKSSLPIGYGAEGSTADLYAVTKKDEKFWEELIYFPVIQHGPHGKRRVQKFF
jgi:hypothetical protein